MQIKYPFYSINRIWKKKKKRIETYSRHLFVWSTSAFQGKQVSNPKFSNPGTISDGPRIYTPSNIENLKQRGITITIINI